MPQLISVPQEHNDKITECMNALIADGDSVTVAVSFEIFQPEVGINAHDPRMGGRGGSEESSAGFRRQRTAYPFCLSSSPARRRSAHSLAPDILLRKPERMLGSQRSIETLGFHRIEFKELVSEFYRWE
jgi:hypothetical protein